MQTCSCVFTLEVVLGSGGGAAVRDPGQWVGLLCVPSLPSEPLGLSLISCLSSLSVCGRHRRGQLGPLAETAGVVRVPQTAGFFQGL